MSILLYMIDDIQNKKPDYAFKLTRVGCVGIKKPIVVKRKNKINHLTGIFDVFVNLPSSIKGTHLSRHIEAINEIVDKSVREPVEGIENLCLMIAKELLCKHGYANYADVNIKTDLFYEKKTPGNIKSLEHSVLIGNATATRDGKETKSIGVSVTGMNVCPCAAEIVRKITKNNTAVSHNQRNISTLIIEVPKDYDIDAIDLLQIIEASFSSPTYEILKRIDEGKVVLKAHKNPMFVEDIVRMILSKVVNKYRFLPDDTKIIVKSESEESIHKHNAFAERITTLGELKK